MAHEAGKGPGRRAGADDAAYREGHDRIDWGAKGDAAAERKLYAHQCAIPDFEDTYARWLRENTIPYRGYEIVLGSVSRNGEALMMTFCPLDPTPEQLDEVTAGAKEWIDAQLAAEAP